MYCIYFLVCPAVTAEGGAVAQSNLLLLECLGEFCVSDLLEHVSQLMCELGNGAINHIYEARREELGARKPQPGDPRYKLIFSSVGEHVNTFLFVPLINPPLNLLAVLGTKNCKDLIKHIFVLLYTSFHFGRIVRN